MFGRYRHLVIVSGRLLLGLNFLGSATDVTRAQQALVSAHDGSQGSSTILKCVDAKNAVLVDDACFDGKHPGAHWAYIPSTAHVPFPLPSPKAGAILLLHPGSKDGANLAPGVSKIIGPQTFTLPNDIAVSRQEVVDSLNEPPGKANDTGSPFLSIGFADMGTRIVGKEATHKYNITTASEGEKGVPVRDNATYVDKWAISRDGWKLVDSMIVSSLGPSAARPGLNGR